MHFARALSARPNVSGHYANTRRPGARARANTIIANAAVIKESTLQSGGIHRNAQLCNKPKPRNAVAPARLSGANCEWRYHRQGVRGIRAVSAARDSARRKQVWGGEGKTTARAPYSFQFRFPHREHTEVNPLEGCRSSTAANHRR